MESLLAQSGLFEDQMHLSWTQSPLCCTEAFEFLGIFIIAKLDFTSRPQQIQNCMNSSGSFAETQMHSQSQAQTSFPQKGE